MGARVGGVLLAAAVCCGCLATYHPPDWTRVPRTSGVDPSKRLVELGAGEREALWAWKVTAFGGSRKDYRCPRGRVSVDTSTEGHQTPAPSAGCTATVADDERCIVRVVDDLCAMAGHLPPECGHVTACWR